MEIDPQNLPSEVNVSAADRVAVAADGRGQGPALARVQHHLAPRD